MRKLYNHLVRKTIVYVNMICTYYIAQCYVISTKLLLNSFLQKYHKIPIST